MTADLAMRLLLPELSPLEMNDLHNTRYRITGST